jgi:hypothetical protein
VPHSNIEEGYLDRISSLQLLKSDENKTGTMYIDDQKTNVIAKSSIFWDIIPCSPLNVILRVRGTYRVHLQD